ncbi:hypothetical protein ACE01N_06670 [Saccharicrinis sp. FJH2]|uniref:hypothetical protein n=1 Tax=unclassified Saccharicrinis TaxID=2646859 RepID=UPI0035D487DB
MANLDKESITKVVLKEVTRQNRGAEIHAKHTRDLPNPARLAWKNKEENYMPDIIVRNGKNGMSIYEIELTDEFDIDKWRLYSMYARRSNGKLHLVLPRWLSTRAKEKIDECNLKNILVEFVTDA